MKKALKIETTCVSAASLIFFKSDFRFFERKMLSTFSTLSTNLIINKLIYNFVLIQSSTFFYKSQILTVFSTFFYDFYTLIRKLLLQIADYVHCRKLQACRKCRTGKCVCPNINYFGQKQVKTKSNHLNTFAK